MLGVLFVEIQLTVYVPCAKVTTLRSSSHSEWLRKQAKSRQDAQVNVHSMSPGNGLTGWPVQVAP